MPVEAIYRGQRNGQYQVQVKTTNPTGKLGDAGVIRYFDTEKEARNYANLVNLNHEDVFVHQPEPKMEYDPSVRHAGDVFIKR